VDAYVDHNGQAHAPSTQEVVDSTAGAPRTESPVKDAEVVHQIYVDAYIDENGQVHAPSTRFVLVDGYQATLSAPTITFPEIPDVVGWDYESPPLDESTEAAIQRMVANVTQEENPITFNIPPEATQLDSTTWSSG
jgi:hypothetical protein